MRLSDAHSQGAVPKTLLLLLVSVPVGYATRPRLLRPPACSPLDHDLARVQDGSVLSLPQLRRPDASVGVVLRRRRSKKSAVLEQKYAMSVLRNGGNQSYLPPKPFGTRGHLHGSPSLTKNSRSSKQHRSDEPANIFRR